MKLNGHRDRQQSPSIGSGILHRAGAKLLIVNHDTKNGEGFPKRYETQSVRVVWRRDSRAEASCQLTQERYD